VFYILLLICLGRWEKYGAAYLELLIGWCLSSQLMRLLRIVLPGRFNYGVPDIGGYLTSTSLTIYLLLLMIIPYLLTKRKNAKFLRLINNQRLKKLAVFIPIAAIIFFVLILIINTAIAGGIWGLAGSSIFTYSDDWGSSRGATFNMGVKLLSRMDLVQILFGVGPDCYAEFLYSFPDLVAISAERFGNHILKNSHNEMLTMLVNKGVIGAAAYLSIFISLFARLIKRGITEPLLYIPVISIFSYLIHNIVSFSQILSLPYIFMVMAIGESYFISGKLRVNCVKEII
jgi:hypothetical protein